MNISNIVGKIIINGTEFIGECLSIVNDIVTIDGKTVSVNVSEKTINITIEGNCGAIQNGVGDITIKGNVTGDVKTGVGNIDSGDILGQAKTGTGDITCDDIGGDCRTGCGDINRRN